MWYIVPVVDCAQVRYVRGGVVVGVWRSRICRIGARASYFMLGAWRGEVYGYVRRNYDLGVPKYYAIKFGISKLNHRYNPDWQTVAPRSVYIEQVHVVGISES